VYAQGFFIHRTFILSRNWFFLAITVPTLLLGLTGALILVRLPSCCAGSLADDGGIDDYGILSDVDYHQGHLARRVWCVPDLALTLAAMLLTVVI
jgi:hypothetical protein